MGSHLRVELPRSARRTAKHMIHIHIHLLPWHWFWRDHHDINTGVKVWWRGPLVVVWLDSNIWPVTAKIKAVTAMRLHP